MHDFSLLLRTGSKPSDINQLGGHPGNIFNKGSLKKMFKNIFLNNTLITIILKVIALVLLSLCTLSVHWGTCHPIHRLMPFYSSFPCL